jgi:hypothetical protein
MPLIPNELELYYYVACLLISALALSVILVNRQAEFMSRRHAGFFYLIACGIFIDGVFGIAQTQDPRLHTIAFFIRTTGLFAWIISIFIKTMVEKYTSRGSHA